MEDVVYGRGCWLARRYRLSGIKTAPASDYLGARWPLEGRKQTGCFLNRCERVGWVRVFRHVDRLVDCTPAPACYQDLQCAIRYVHAHARQYNIDTNRIFLIGQSAGGHLVSLAATLGAGPFPRTGGWKEAPNDFVAAISVAANDELTTLSWGNIWTPATGDAVEARKFASPVNHVKKEMKPLLILPSDNDQSVPIQNAIGMVEALTKVDAPATFHRYPTAGHMGITAEVIARSLEFIKQQSTENNPKKSSAVGR
jgi:acetyl esterase/lipase